MKHIKLFVLAIFISLLLWTCWSEKDIHLYMIGDSTMANKPLLENPERGWGQVFPEFFKDNVKIHNHARNGRSTKSFLDQGLWQAVLDSLKPGDYVMIQFGHNDQKISDSTRYTAPRTGYRTNLIRYVTESREKGASPILLTPVMRRRFDKDGKFYDAHGEYPDVVRE
ncbi:MAG: rhamnogalacturonan acetylesterase, partial [Calditrichales bacterium]